MNRNLTRRSFVTASAAAAGGWLLGRSALAADGVRELTAASGEHRLYGSSESKLWLYGNRLPGPEIRMRRGERLRARLVNRLDEPTTIHWHGIRIDNAMDGVPGLTQAAVAPGDSFEYDFVAPDAGTFWYHAHNRSWSQVTRGLFGPLIVEEESPVFDREHDIVLVLTDWLLDETGVFHEASMGQPMHWSHAGRLGNWMTVNGESRPDIPVRAGEWYRLRLINASTARILEIDPARFGARIIAFDGQMLETPGDAQATVQLAPAQRLDLVMMHREPGPVAFEMMNGEPFEFARFIVAEGTGEPAPEPALPAANPLPRPVLEGARHFPLRLDGGAMGRLDSLTRGGERLTREQIVSDKLFWGLNGQAGMPDAPMFQVATGESVVLESANETAFPHAMHLHGHHFLIIGRNGKMLPDPVWRDTFLAAPGERVTIAFVADNPGKWLLHCHMLEHAAAGMMSWFAVA